MKNLILYSIYTDSMDEPVASGYSLENENMVGLEDARGLGFIFWHRNEDGTYDKSEYNYFIGVEFKRGYDGKEMQIPSLSYFTRRRHRQSEDYRNPRVGIFLDEDENIIDIRSLGENESMVLDHDELMKVYDENVRISKNRAKVIEKLKKRRH